MNLGSIVRRAVSAFSKSKTRPHTHATTPHAHGTHSGHSSAESDLGKSAARVVKKKL